MVRENRNSSIELLRIIAAMGVVILHYNLADAGGGFKYVTEGSVNQYYLFLSESIFACAVDLFVMISAYFLSITKKRKIIKVIELVIEVIFFNIFFYMLSVCEGTNVFSIKSILGCLLPVNYFTILYSVLYIISPYLNLLLEQLDQKRTRNFIVLNMMIFGVWTISVDYLEGIFGWSLDGLSTVGMFSVSGYNIVNFVLLYFIGAYIRLYDVQIVKKKLIVQIFFITLIIWISSIIEQKMGVSSISTWNYNNPLIIVFAALVMLLFLKINFHSKVINELAKATFTCYLFHGFFMKEFWIAEFVEKPLFYLILHQLWVAVILYMVSYVIYQIYEYGSRWLIKIIEPMVEKNNISL